MEEAIMVIKDQNKGGLGILNTISLMEILAQITTTIMAMAKVNLLTVTQEVSTSPEVHLKVVEGINLQNHMEDTRKKKIQPISNQCAKMTSSKRTKSKTKGK